MSSLIISRLGINHTDHSLPNNIANICLEYLDQESLKLVSQVNAKFKKLVVDDMFEKHVAAWFRADVSNPNALFEKATLSPLIPLTDEKLSLLSCMIGNKTNQAYRTTSNQLVFWRPSADKATYAHFYFKRTTPQDWDVTCEERTCFIRTDFRADLENMKGHIFYFHEGNPKSPIITPDYVCPLAFSSEGFSFYRSSQAGDLNRITQRIRDQLEEFVTGEEKIPCHKRAWKAIVNCFKHAWNGISRFFERAWAVVFKFFQKNCCRSCNNSKTAIHFYNGAGPIRHFYNSKTVTHLYVHGGNVPAEYQNENWKEVV